MVNKFTPELWLTASLAEQSIYSKDITLKTCHALLDQASFEHAKSGARVLDIGCGLGQITDTIAERYSDRPLRVVAGDIDASVVEAGRRRYQAVGIGHDPGVEFRQMDVMNLPYPADYFDYIFGAFLFFNIAEGFSAIEESIHKLKPGGTLGFTTWNRPGHLYALKHAQDLSRGYPFNGTTGPSAKIIDTFRYLPGSAEMRATLVRLGMVSVRLEQFAYTIESPSAADLAGAMWPDVAAQAGWLGRSREERQRGWEQFRKIEGVLQKQFGYGEVAVPVEAWIVTARKPRR